MLDFSDLLYRKLKELTPNITVSGFVDQSGIVIPLDSDTKVLSMVFEKICRNTILEIAYYHNYEVSEPKKQNYYPDFTLQERKPLNPKGKIALDVKTTYRRKNSNTLGYTLGSYSSFIRNNVKNIVFPFDEYSEHWKIGFVYDRIEKDNSVIEGGYSIETLDEIQLPYINVDVFVQEKWRIAGDQAGSGNTANIGSIQGTIEDFQTGNGPFISENEFLEYWQNFGLTKNDREKRFSNIQQFRQLISESFNS